MAWSREVGAIPSFFFVFGPAYRPDYCSLHEVAQLGNEGIGTSVIFPLAMSAAAQLERAQYEAEQGCQFVIDPQVQDDPRATIWALVLRSIAGGR